MTNDSGFLTSHQDLSGYVPKSGGAVMTGWLGKTTDNSHFSICGATSDTKGAIMWLYGNDNPNYTGSVRIKLTDSNAGEHWFTLYPSGYAGWNGKALAMQEDTVPRSGGSVLNATLLGRVDTDNIIRICGGTDNMAGASIQLNGKDTVGNKGMMFLVGYDGTSRNTLTIKPDGNITAGNGVVTKNVAMREDAISEKASRTTTGDWTITGLIPYKPVYLKVYVTSNRLNNSTSVPSFLVLAVSNVCGLATMASNTTFYISPDGFITTNKVIASFSSFVSPSETGTLNSTFIAYILPLSSSITIGLRNHNINGNSISLDSAYLYQ